MPWSRDPISLWPRDRSGFLAKSLYPRGLGSQDGWMPRRLSRSRVFLQLDGDEREVVGGFSALAVGVDRIQHRVEDILGSVEDAVKAAGEPVFAHAFAGGGLDVG